MDKKTFVLIIIFFIGFIYFFAPNPDLKFSNIFSEGKSFIEGVQSTGIDNIKENPEKYVDKNVTVVGKIGPGNDALDRDYKPIAKFTIGDLLLLSSDCDPRIRKIKAGESIVVKAKVKGVLKSFEICECNEGQYSLDPWYKSKKCEKEYQCKNGTIKDHYYIDCRNYEELN